MVDIKKNEICELVKEAKRIGEKLNDDEVKTNQIRNFYSSISKMKVLHKQGKIDQLWIELCLLKPKLAYAAGRQTPVRKTFKPELTFAIESIENIKETEERKEVITKFFAFVESLVAYHKFFGDK